MGAAGRACRSFLLCGGRPALLWDQAGRPWPACRPCGRGAPWMIPSSASRTIAVDQLGARSGRRGSGPGSGPGRPDARVGVARDHHRRCGRARRPPGRGRPRWSWSRPSRSMATTWVADGVLRHAARCSVHGAEDQLGWRARRCRRSSASSLAWIGLSTVAMKRVPMLTPSAPSASAATRPRASPKPPEAIIGIGCHLVGRRRDQHDQAGHVVPSPGWPAHSRKPSMEMASTPIALHGRQAEWRTEVHLCSTLIPPQLEFLDVVDQACCLRGLDDLDARSR